jgi:NAD(P)H dehydrogenase (quinone)
MRRLATLLVLVLAIALIPRGVAGAAEGERTGAIVISGASGRLAGDAIAELLARGVAFDQLILVTRTPEKLASYADAGITVRHGDFNAPEGLPAAFEGGRKLLLISTSEGDRVAQHTAAINAARRAGIRHIVYTSFTNPVADNPATVARDHRLTEEALKRSGIAYTILRNQRYADMLVAHAEQALATGEIVTNAGRGKWAPVARRDCAAAAAVVLTTNGHEGRTYDITGPDLINERDFAQMLMEISGRRVRVLEVSDTAYIASLLKAGVPEGAATARASIGLATRTHYLNIKSDALEILIGRKPQSVRDLLEDNKARLR